jgi:hypothetical protein
MPAALEALTVWLPGTFRLAGPPRAGQHWGCGVLNDKDQTPTVQFAAILPVSGEFHRRTDGWSCPVRLNGNIKGKRQALRCGGG